MPSAFSLTVHDDVPAADRTTVDEGLEAFNLSTTPLHEVRPLGCFARDEAGTVIGGAVGRRWGRVVELQQLWVHEAWRGKGTGTALVRAFEAHARAHGCDRIYLETFSFQAPDFYRRLGYAVAHAHADYPHGIFRFLMRRELADG